MQQPILVTGSLAFDFIMDFPGKFADNIDPTKIHILNISFLVESLKKQKGGTAGNIAYTLSLLKQKPTILSTAGNDFLEFEDFFRKNGIETKAISIIKTEPTAQATIITDLMDNQITAFYPGAMKHTGGLSIKAIKEKFKMCIISPFDPKAMTRFVRECKDLKIPYMFDPGMQLPRLSDKELEDGVKSCDILIGNDYEMGLIMTRLNLSLPRLTSMAKIVITTLGGSGSKINTNSEEISISPARAKGVVDPTGAGDAYRAGFLAGFLNGKDLKTSGQMGSVAACYAVEKYGTISHKFNLEEFGKRYKENFGELLSLSSSG